MKTKNNRKDVLSKVRGKTLYANDIYLPKMVHAVTVRSTVANGRVLNVDSQAAMSVPGVLGVLLAKDIPGIANRPKERPILCGDRVRYIGDGIALVVAETRGAAAKAAKRISVDYEVLPPVFDAEQALQAKAPLVHEECTDNNVLCYFPTKRGDVEKAFSQADFILEREYHTSRVQHVCIETEAVVCAYDADTELATVYCPTNAPFQVRAVVADTLGCSFTDVCVKLMAIGGSFGGKNYDMSANAARAALVAKKFGRPCKVVLTREESIEEGTKRHPLVARYKVGYTKEGVLKGAQVRLILDAGSYTSKSSAVTSRMAIEATGPYFYEAVNVEANCVYTNNVYSDALRGFGSPQINFCSECLMDEIAQDLQMDAMELRKKNMVKTGFISSVGQMMEDVTLSKCVEALEKKVNISEKKAEICAYNASHTDSKKGLGFALMQRGESFGAAGSGVDVASGMVSIQPDGSVSVMSSIADVGQGAQTMVINIVCETFGIPRDKIRVCKVDTSSITDAGPTVATRGTVFSGGAIYNACTQLKTKLISYAQLYLGTQDVVFKNEMVCEQKKEENRVSLLSVIQSCFANADHLNSLGFFNTPPLEYDKKNGVGQAYLSYVYGACAVEVLVNTITGAVVPTEIYTVHDVGHAFDIEEVKGQMYGGVVMGVGYALLEDVIVKNGKIINSNFESYLTPTVMDTPKITPVVLEIPGPYGPLGAKGLGEPATCMAAPAILNAICDATGRRIRSLPASLERVALKNEEGKD